jgi:hypothetical protein
MLFLRPSNFHIAFVTNWGAFVWVVMPFGVKNGPPTYQRVVTKAFREYINLFMKKQLDDFIVFSDLSTHLEKLIKCFLKCREYGISLNLENCAFMVCFGTILRFIVLTEGKTLDPKKIEALVKMLVPKTPQEIQFLLGTLLLFMVLLGFLVIKYPKVTSVKVTTMSI